ncbi:hypothetical protein DV515_00004223 [Chloebia gouldiae]|uniref:Uncharacterized protein n=1 Tax=Chloebia gouldiae TaxID=44316 RepID=A0A3L8SRX2_CHLGU|nr:hypothetical protein DV515_00004223 [Chloebia gouldiae]
MLSTRACAECEDDWMGHQDLRVSQNKGLQQRCCMCFLPGELDFNDLGNAGLESCLHRENGGFGPGFPLAIGMCTSRAQSEGLPWERSGQPGTQRGAGWAVESYSHELLQELPRSSGNVIPARQSPLSSPRNKQQTTEKKMQDNKVQWKRKNTDELRAHIYPTREFLARGRQDQYIKACRHCDADIETCAHIIGNCPVTQDARIKRHKYICKLLLEEATKKGWAVFKEPHIRDSNKNCTNQT